MESQRSLFNQISDEIKPKPLKKGETALFEVEGTPRDVNVPNIDTIWDPGKQDYVQIALIKSFNQMGQANLDTFWFSGKSRGKLILTGGKQFDDKLYQYLMLSNYNGTNPNRDTDKKVLFRQVKPELEAQARRAERAMRRAAVDVVSAWTDEQVTAYWVTKGVTVRPADIDVYRDKLEDIAEKRPEDFYREDKSAPQVNEGEMADTLKLANKKNLISFDKESATWLNKDGEAITTVSKKVGAQYKEFVEFCMSSEEGQSVYEGIVKELSEE